MQRNFPRRYERPSFPFGISAFLLQPEIRVSNVMKKWNDSALEFSNRPVPFPSSLEFYFRLFSQMKKDLLLSA